MREAERYLADRAWVEGAWRSRVLLVADAGGSWSKIRPECPAGDANDARRLAGAALPGMVDAHSHAFQHAIAGITETLPSGRTDTFWSWRDRMYKVALSLRPQQLEDIAATLYAQLLQGGYTHVCEFHYLHNDLDGRPYADPQEMAMALVRAARRAGIGLTLLPTLYMRSGFGAAGLRPDQRRFASTPEGVLRLAEAVRALGGATLTAGVALHSLRAVDEGALRETAQAARAMGMPVHLHVAEQQQEVDDCVARHGLRPIEWLLDNVAMDASWNLVHATQATEEELLVVRRCGASIVICPTTEANLGDGVFDLVTWLRARGSWSIGSDSNVCRGWAEELRLLEYSQRLVHRRRNVAAEAAGASSTATVLFDGAIGGGSAASGLPMAGFIQGSRADVCLLPATDAPDALASAVFTSPAAAARAVVVAGRPLAAPSSASLT